MYSSSFLFALYLNDLVDALSMRITNGDTTMKVLIYADDIVLLSDSLSNLEIMIDSLHEYCDLWHLKVNLLKSKILVYRNGTIIPKSTCAKKPKEDI